jgi:hypothetical protein
VSSLVVESISFAPLRRHQLKFSNISGNVTFVTSRHALLKFQVSTCQRCRQLIACLVIALDSQLLVMAARPQQPPNQPQNQPQNAQPQPASSSSASANSTSSIPQSAAAGGLTITQPPQTATSFFKIAQSQYITFAWNFTSLLSTPTHLTVSAACANGNTYPVGPTNGIIPGTATSVVWDPYGYDQANPNTPLAQASYTLMIWDDRGPNPPRAPGLLQPNSALTFALYTPQPYTPIASGE